MLNIHKNLNQELKKKSMNKVIYKPKKRIYIEKCFFALFLWKRWGQKIVQNMSHPGAPAGGQGVHFPPLEIKISSIFYV